MHNYNFYGLLILQLFRTEYEMNIFILPSVKPLTALNVFEPRFLDPNQSNRVTNFLQVFMCLLSY